MNTMKSSSDVEFKSPQTKLRNTQFMRAVMVLSRVVTLIFLAALVWAVYQALFNRNPLPVWAWLGLVTLLVVAVGLVVKAVIYRGVTRQVGPFHIAQNTSCIVYLGCEGCTACR